MSLVLSLTSFKILQFALSAVTVASLSKLALSQNLYKFYVESQDAVFIDTDWITPYLISPFCYTRHLNMYYQHSLHYLASDLLAKKPTGYFSYLDLETFGCYWFQPHGFYIQDVLINTPASVQVFTALSLYVASATSEYQAASLIVPQSDLKFIAFCLYEHYYLHLLILGLIFFIVIIGVISLLLNRNLKVKRQDIYKQQNLAIPEFMGLAGVQSSNVSQNK